MQVRFPKWDFSKVRAHWAPNREFAQMQNAASVIPAYIEPYLVKVMQKAQAQLPAKHEKLHQDLAIFIKQEMQHCRQHLLFNKALRADGYEGMLAIEKEYEADYARFLATKSLRFNCAYSEGFEAVSSVAVTNYFEEFGEFLEGADPEAVELWKWHLAEEFEHREVAHEVYHALFGTGPVAYVYRIWAFFYAVNHLRGYVRKVQDYLLSKDRETMTPDELEASLARQKHVQQVTGRRAKEHLKVILSPFYKPAKRVAPPGLQDYLDRYARTPVAAA
ncbi:MAG: metal-dependent hydrolase [Sphingomonadales bacterium]|nr:MAG: metal-dependent hydrolase [Sphingomonadales bacterium]